MHRVLLIAFLIFQNLCFSNVIEKSKDSVDYYIKSKDYLKGLNYAREKSNSYLENKEFQKYCKVSIQKSLIYFFLNDTEKTFEVLFKALKIAEDHQLLATRVEILEEIGHRYATISNFKKAKIYYDKSFSLGKKNNLIKPDSFIYQRLYRTHFELDTDSAYYFMNKVMLNAKKTKNVEDLAQSYNNFYTYYSFKEHFEYAKKYLDSSLLYAKEAKKPNLLSVVYSNLGYHSYVVDKNYNVGVRNYLKSLEFNGHDTLSNNVSDTYINLSFGYEMMGDFKKSNYYLNKYVDLNDAIYQGNIKKAITDIETKYRIEKIENANKERQKILEEKQKNNQKIILIFIALFAFSTILFYFFYQNLRLKQKNKFSEIDGQIKQNIINASIDGQEIERKKIAGILHDSISALLSSAGLHLSAHTANHPDEFSEEIKKTRSILKEAHDNVRDLSHELIPPLLVKFGFFHALQDLCEKNSNSMLQFEYSSFIPQTRRYNEEFEMRIYFIIAELFNNIMKHSKASKAYITLEENNGELLINVEDDGKGFDASNEFSSDGFGLTQIKSRIKHLKGKILISSKINIGTLIYIKLHIPK